MWLGWVLWRALDLDRFCAERLVAGRERVAWSAMAALDYDLLLYDVTSTYFEGQAAANRLAKRGYSRDHRGDCKQVCIGLVVTRGGIPLGYEVFAGNRVDVTTFEEVVTTMERRYGRAERVWVVDRGMTSAENIAWLKASGRRYLIGTPKSELKRFAGELADRRDWLEVREGLEVKACAGPEGEETFLLVRSVDRQQKEAAMHARFCERIEMALARLERRIAGAKKPIDRSAAERQIGRLLGRNSRAAARYQIRLVDDPASAAGLRLEWCQRPEWDDWAQTSEGCYVLRTNLADWTSEELWRTYIQLSEAEAAFRIHKSELSIRPIWHQRTDRVLAHILVCFLAYVLWKALEQWQSRAGLFAV
jgi:transposase